MPAASQRDEEGRAVVPYRAQPARPAMRVPDNPADIAVDELVDYAERAVKWLLEQCMDETSKTPEQAKARQIEQRNVAELRRTLEDLLRLKKVRAADTLTRKTNEQLGEAVLTALRKIVDGRRT